MSDPFDLAQADPAPAPPAPTTHVAPVFLDGLNPAQRQAAEHLDGPVLVLAGAGTGKTRVLTARLASVLHRHLAWPSEVLAVTFTNKAAREMRDRVAGMVGRAVEGLWLGTFHSIGVRILRRHAELVGLKSNFTILDTDDQLRLMRQVMEAENIDQKRFPPRAMLATIDRWKDKGLTPDQVPAGEAAGLAAGKDAQLYRAYQARLLTLNACDFGDLLLHPYRLFLNDAEVLGRYQRQFKYILVDEYQDTNVLQYLLLRLLAQQHRNICCVGDDDQSIYSWRGAEVGNILRFEKDFEGAAVIRLERNYRSTPHILAAASGLIAHNEGRLGKTLWTEDADGPPVALHGLWDGPEEARFVADEVEAGHRDGLSLNHMAILVRASHQTREFEERFITIGVPYRIIGGARFYERAEIRDAIAYFRVIAQPDDDLAFERIVNTPKRGLGQAALRVLHQASRASGRSLAAIAGEIVESDELRPQARKSLGSLMADLRRWRDLEPHMNHIELAESVLDESGYTAMWQADKSPDAAGRLENLKELIRALAGFENLGGFLEHVSLVAENEAQASEEAVNIMTLHGAKGLEFDTVFLPGWEEGLFPHQRALDEGGIASLEEERRLAYVGLTRAKRRAVVSFAANRRIFDRWQSALPSRFVAELPDANIHREVATGLHGGATPMQAQVAFGDGWRGGPRMRRVGQTAPLPVTIDGRAEAVVSSDPEDTRFSVGERIFHQKFGYGRIRSVEGNKLGVEFEKAGSKKVIDSFVERQ